GRYFTEDADFIAHSGLWWTSRRDNVEGHQDVPADVIAGKTHYTQQVESVAEVAPGVALVHTRWNWPDPEPGARDRAGVISYLLVQRDGRRLIRAAHNTRSRSRWVCNRSRTTGTPRWCWCRIPTTRNTGWPPPWPSGPPPAETAGTCWRHVARRVSPACPRNGPALSGRPSSAGRRRWSGCTTSGSGTSPTAASATPPTFVPPSPTRSPGSRRRW